MKVTKKVTRYGIPLAINIVLITPFIRFLVSPQSSSAKFIQSVYYLLLLKVVSFSIVMLFTDPKIRQWPNILYLTLPFVFVWQAYKNVGWVFAIYFLGSYLVDLLTIQRNTKRKNAKWGQDAFARLFLLMLLMIPSGIIGSFIERHYREAVGYYHVFKSTDEIGAFITVLIYIILYYLFEPFARPIYDLIFGDNKFSKFLFKKL